MKPPTVACVCLTVVVGAATAQNLLTNGSFNGNLNGWTYDPSTTYDPTLDATGIRGSGSAKGLVPPESGDVTVYQCVAIMSSTIYKAGGKVFIPSGQATTGWSSIAILWYSDNVCGSSAFIGVGENLYVTASGAWVTVDTGFITAPANTKSAQFRADIGNPGTTGAFQVNFDDLVLTAGAAAYSRWIPAVIHKDVPSKNAKWRSDVAVLNRSTSTANLTITMYPTAGPVTRTTQLAGSSQLLQTDIAGWLGVTTDSGPLEVTSDQDVFLSGRTFNQVDATHTYGQDYDGQEPSELLAAQQSAWLPQLAENALYRTNIGITNTGTATANVTLTLYDANGNKVGSDDTRDYTPGGFYQYQQPYQPLGGIASGYAMVTVNSGAGVVAYASVIDNNTGDPTTITMKR